jgi:hypothetical protein
MKIKIYSKITTVYRLQRAKSMEHGAWGMGRRAKSEELRAKSGEQRAKSKSVLLIFQEQG